MRTEYRFDRLRLGEVALRRRCPVRVDVTDLLRLHARAGQRRAHHLGDADRVRIGLGHVMRVVRGAVAKYLGIDARASPLGVLELLEQHHARPLAHHEAGARSVEGTGRERRIFILCDEPTHCAEAGEDDAGACRTRCRRRG